MQYIIASTLALAGSAVATYAAAASAPVIHQVSVSNANGDLTFTPNDFTAMKGDFVEFTFNPKNHSVAQSNFANPCIPIDESVPAHGPGFFSGYMPVTAGESPMKTFAIEVTDVSKPIWFYCSQGKHCQSGMVGVINATPQQTLEGFKQLAKNVSVNTPPKQLFGAVDLSTLTNTTTNWNTTTTTLENTYTSTVDTLTTLETAWTVSDSTVTTTVTAPVAGYTSTSSTGSSDTGSTGSSGSSDTGSTGSTGSSGSSDTGSSGSADTSSTGTASTTSGTTSGSDLTSGIAQSNSASGLVGSSPLSLLGLVAAGVFFLA